MREIFKSLDKNKDGRISFDELYVESLKHAKKLEIIIPTKVPMKKADELKSRVTASESVKAHE